MTTNGASALDKGLRYGLSVFDFPQLDAKDRLKCWENFIDIGVLEIQEGNKEEVEGALDQLADEFKLSGRDIRDAIHLACSIAAEEEGDHTKIRKRHSINTAG